MGLPNAWETMITSISVEFPLVLLFLSFYHYVSGGKSLWFQGPEVNKYNAGGWGGLEEVTQNYT